MRNLQIAAAWAGVCASGAAHALPPTATYDIQLVVAGSSVHRNMLQDIFTSICQASTLNLYQASPTANQDFRAYSCALTFSGLPASIGGRNAILYYRSEGGSVYGVGPLAKNVPIKRLVVNSMCTAATPPAFGNCPVSGYNGWTDTAFGGSNLVNSLVDLGVSDVEPSRFAGENWPASGTSVLGSQPSAAQLNALSSQTAMGTVFGVLVHRDLTAVTDLSRQDINSIFTGQYGDWSQVASANNTGTTAGAITVCRQDPGLGMQIAASIYFNGQGCPVGYPFVTAPSGPLFGNPVIQTYSNSSMNTCVSTRPGSIGVQIYTVTPPSNTKWVTINGKQPGKVAAALGDYDFWFESTFNKDEVVHGKPLENALTDVLVRYARSSGRLPNNDSALALYNDGRNWPEIPVHANRPHALGTRSGNSCLPPQGTF